MVMENKNNTRVYSTTKDYETRVRHYPVYTFFRRLLKACYRSYIVEYKTNQLHVGMYVANHCKMHGPLAIQLYFPKPKRLWADGDLCYYKSVTKYARANWLSSLKGLAHWFASILLFLPSLLFPYIMKREQVIPVYRDMRGLVTFRKNNENLKSGANSVILGESPVMYSRFVNKLNRGIVDAGKMAQGVLGVCYFYPVYICPALRRIEIGEPIKYDESIPLAEQKESICVYLQEQITKLGQELPKHKVINF